MFNKVVEKRCEWLARSAMSICWPQKLACEQLRYENKTILQVVQDLEPLLKSPRVIACDDQVFDDLETLISLLRELDSNTIPTQLMISKWSRWMWQTWGLSERFVANVGC